MKNTALMHLSLAICLLTGCGGSGGGDSTTPESSPPPTTDTRVSLPAVTLSGITSNVGIQPAASAAMSARAIDGTRWSPVCATNAGITSLSNQTALSVDNACLASMSVFEVSGIMLGDAEAKSRLHGVFTADQVKNGTAAVTLLTELAYQQVHLLLAAGRPDTEILAKLNTVSAWLLTRDINSDGVINYDDLIAWRQSEGDGSLRLRLDDLNEYYVTQTDAGLAALEAVNAITLGNVGNDDSDNALLAETISTANNTLFSVLSNGSIAAADLDGTVRWKTTFQDDGNTVSVTALKASQDYLVAAGCITVQAVKTCNKVYVASLPASGVPVFDNMLDVGAPIRSIKMSNDRLLVATAHGVFDVDITTAPMTVVATDSAAAEPAQASILVATETHVYALTSSTLTVLNRATLEMVGSLEYEHGFSVVADAVLLNNHLVVAAGLAGVLTFDVSDPSAPKEGNTIISATTSESTTALALVNNAVVALSSAGLRSFTFDEAGVLQPSSRLFVRHVHESGGMVVANNALFFTRESGKVLATASSNLLYPLPVSIGQLSVLGASTITKEGSTLYVGTLPTTNIEGTTGKIVSVDASVPSAPALIREYPVAGGVNAITIHGDRMGIANPPFGYGVIDINSGNELSRDDDLSGTAVGLTPNETYDVVHNRYGLAVFDTTNAAKPVATLAPTGLTDSWDGVIKNGTLLQAQGSFGIGVVAIAGSSVSSIKNVSTTDGLGWEGTLQSWSVALSGNTLYSAGCAHLSVLDVSTPTSPKVLHQTVATPCLMQVSVAGNIAYVLDADGTLSVFDVTTPSQPLFLGFLPVASPVNHVFATESNVFLLEDSRILRVLNAVRPLPLSTAN